MHFLDENLKILSTEKNRTTPILIVTNKTSDLTQIHRACQHIIVNIVPKLLMTTVNTSGFHLTFIL